MTTEGCSFLFPGHTTCFDLHRCLFHFSHLSCTTHFRLPSSSHMPYTPHARRTHDISVTMATSSEAPRLLERALLFRTLFCVASKTRPDGRRADVSVTAKPTLCVCACVRGLWVSVCVCHWLGHRARAQECRTGCREKIPETVESVQNTAWGASDCNTAETQQTLTFIPRVQFTLCVFSP